MISRTLPPAALLLGLQIFAAGVVDSAELRIREVEPPGPIPADSLRPDQLPGSVVALGERNIAAAWLAGPTPRYGHGVLGDRIEASRLVVETRDRTMLVHELPKSRVFEDLIPRLFDLNGDGEDEILIVETDSELGASLSVYAVVDGRLVRRTMTPFLGQPYRWLNPLGVGDFDADGRLDIALVATPHIGGRLRLYRNSSPRLVQFAEFGGVSTHSIGSGELGLGRVVPGTDRDRFLLPDQSHALLLLLEWTPSGIRERARAKLPSPILTSLEPAGDDRWRFESRDGRHLEVRLR